MKSYKIQTLTPFIIEDLTTLSNDSYYKNLETALKNSLKNLILFEYINSKKNEFNDFITQTLELFLLSPNIFLKKENSLLFYIKCSLEMEKKELKKEFEYIDNINMHFLKYPLSFENITLITNFHSTSKQAILRNLTITFTSDKNINFNKYSNFIQTIIEAEEKFFNKKFKFYLLKRTRLVNCLFSTQNYKSTNFLIISEIHSFFYNLNNQNCTNLNKLLSNAKLNEIEEGMNRFGVDKKGEIVPLNFLKITQIF